MALNSLYCADVPLSNYSHTLSVESKIPRAGSKLSEAKLPSDNLPTVVGILPPIEGKLIEGNLTSAGSNIPRTEGKLLVEKLHPL